MKRRGFLRSVPVALSGIRAPWLAPLVPFALPGTSTAGARTSASPSAAEADWLARSTAPGVLWAHDFRNDDEFHNFHKGNAMPYENGQTAPAPMPYHATLVPTPFGTSRAIRSAARGTHLTRAVPAAKPGAIQTWHVADATKIEEPWAGEYQLIVAAREYVWVQSRDLSESTITVRRTKRRAYPAGKTTIGTGPQGRWIRPMAAFPAGANGKATPDQGLTNGAARKTRNWNPADKRMHGKFREAYFGHRSYWDSAHGDARYKDWTPNTGRDNETRADAWEGDEFYLQFRAKISESRIAEGAPAAKMLYIQNCTTSGQAQFYWGVGAKSKRTEVPRDWPHGPNYGRMLVASTAYGDRTAVFGSALTMPPGGTTNSTKKWADGEEETIWQQHPDFYPNARYRGGSSRVEGWHLPAEKWVTYLIHIKPGRDSVIQYASSTLTRPASELVYAEKPSEVLHLADVSNFPDVEGPGNYPYYVHTAKSANPQLHEHMLVTAIDRAANTLTVQRNARRSFVSSVRDIRFGWDAGAPIAYGPYRGFPGKPKDQVFWPFGVSSDKRLQYRETTVEIFVAVEGEADYTKITSYDKFAWLFGDMKAEYLNYEYNPPGLNSVELSQYLNDYVGSGAVAPPSGEHDIQYTQAIFSREFIPVPRV